MRPMTAAARLYWSSRLSRLPIDWKPSAGTMRQTLRPSALTGMPYISIALWDGKTTNSMLEAHRLNSPYIMRDDAFKTQSAGRSRFAGEGVGRRRCRPGATSQGVPSDTTLDQCCTGCFWKNWPAWRACSVVCLGSLRHMMLMFPTAAESRTTELRRRRSALT